MIEKFYSATLDYVKFSFGVMLAMTAIFALISVTKTHPSGVTTTIGALALLKIAEAVLERNEVPVPVAIRSASFGLRVVVNLLSLVLSISAITRLIGWHKHEDVD